MARGPKKHRKMIWPLASPDGAAKGGVPVAGARYWRGRHAKWHGALTQLGERLHGMQEVSSSIPLGSTITKRPATAGIFCCWRYRRADGGFGVGSRSEEHTSERQSLM